MNTRQLSYTPDGQIKSIRDSTQDKQGNKTEKLIATYQYNHLRQRIAKSTYHKDDKTGQIKEETTQYLWYKGLLSAEIKDDKVVRRYIYLDIMPAAVLDYGYDSKGKLNETKVYSVHTDHLGTPKAVSDKDKNIVWQAKMDTFGETKSIDSKNGFEFNLRFAGQYYDDETGYHYNYHRYYDPNIGRYLTSDPIGLAGGLNSYGYANGRPYEFVDVYGLKVILTLNRSTNTLTVIDTDHYQAGLPMVNNLPSTYKFGGIRDKNGKLTTNQMLIIRNVFTGGQTYEGVGIYRNPERLSVQQPIPVGIYHIVTNRGDTNPKHADWFRLDAQDSIPFNDRHEPTGRDGFRLHSGMESHGCTTFDVYNQEAMLGWSVLKQILNSTSTSLVRDKRGRQGYDPLALMENYGQIEITGKDGISIFEDNK